MECELVRAINIKRLPGQYYDQETGLHYNYFRDYDPTTGRYIQADRLDVLHRTGDPQLLMAASAGSIQLPFGGIGSFDVNGESYQFTAVVAQEVGLNHLFGYANQNPVNNYDVSGLNPGRAAFAAALAIAKALKKKIEKGIEYCKSIQCKLENHDAHHKFGWPYNERRKHIQLTCWRKGVKNSTFIFRIPY